MALIAMQIMNIQFKRFQGRVLISSLETTLVILAKSVTTFCPHPKNLPEVTLKSFGLMALAEEISRLPSIDCLMAVGVYSCANL